MGAKSTASGHDLAMSGYSHFVWTLNQMNEGMHRRIIFSARLFSAPRVFSSRTTAHPIGEMSTAAFHGGRFERLLSLHYPGATATLFALTNQCS
jgi:hypothetical protein